MTYQIITQDETVMVKINQDGITETLNMLDAPRDSSMLVLQGKKEVLGEINLEKMLTNLDNCVDLLQITFNAVDGFSVQSKVQRLSNQFIDAMNKSNAAALDFKLAAAGAVETYIYAYGNLFYGEIEGAIMFLADTKSVATKMVKKADELVKVYDGLTSYCNIVLTEVMDERAADEKKLTETKALIVELEGSIKAMNDIKENLRKDIEQFEADYKSLQEREMKEEERAHNMQTAALVLNVVGAIFGVATDSNSGSKEELNQSELQAEDEPSSETKAKRDYKDNINQQEQKKAAIKKADERIAEIDTFLDGQLYKGGANNASADQTNPDSQKTDEQLRSEKSAKVTEKEKLNTELSTLKGKEATIGNTLKGLGVALDKLSEDTRNTAQQIQKSVESLAARSENIRKKRDELKDQERLNIVKLAENTAKMQNMVIDANSLESAIQCLVIAIGCLRKVLAYLQEIKLFWMNVETFCDNIANNDNIAKLIAMQGNKTPEQRAAYFKTILFVKGFIGVIAKWQALHLIFSEYLSALAKVSKRMSQALEQGLDPDRKKQWQLATKLAGELKDKLNLELSEV